MIITDDKFRVNVIAQGYCGGLKTTIWQDNDMIKLIFTAAIF